VGKNHVKDKGNSGQKPKGYSLNLSEKKGKTGGKRVKTNEGEAAKGVSKKKALLKVPVWGRRQTPQ